ncbi:GNAT family N-acetyltransferase [Pseudomarimonas salicorniae]|uniref:GNAT family N-acetyltransferase n=1 Tax=Pseudomarimonas salicorniae TaxID=2933270 RepID=A0ABT0GK55_9GAMM|nr:GNAT family N-acetyltransferase [Lysobacter sp. CAU 1642]MCK7594935.1 GNAT family N-acetyltransferase [Lysobacter sp. CAU 1642]
MPITIRDVAEHELDSVLALNNAAGINILPLDAAGVRHFYRSAAYFRVAEVDGLLTGFLIALDASADYDSSNFLWFRERYPEFLYIDRIVIASPRRGVGVGRAFYADVNSFAEVRVPQLTCEVFLEPRNDVAVLFHGTYGFHEVGQHVMPGVDRRVSMLAKTLCSYPFVKQTYLERNGLPDEPWLRDRSLPSRAAQRATGT